MLIIECFKNKKVKNSIDCHACFTKNKYEINRAICTKRNRKILKQEDVCQNQE